jgi:mannose-1-phosphate guanylyltransferase/mannose-6-phosphate isomerase
LAKWRGHSRNCNVATDRALVALGGRRRSRCGGNPSAGVAAEGRQGSRRLIAKLKKVAPQATEEHIKVHRSWSSYQSVDNGDRHQITHIIVKPDNR